MMVMSKSCYFNHLCKVSKMMVMSKPFYFNHLCKVSKINDGNVDFHSNKVEDKQRRGIQQFYINKKKILLYLIQELVCGSG
jgi:hypothetical protein